MTPTSCSTASSTPWNSRQAAGGRRQAENDLAMRGPDGTPVRLPPPASHLPAPRALDAPVPRGGRAVPEGAPLPARFVGVAPLDRRDRARSGRARRRDGI